MFQKHCLTEEGHKCIPRDQKCECGEGMEYCDSKQHCMHAERMRDPDECPPVCDEGKVNDVYFYLHTCIAASYMLDVGVLSCYFHILSGYK